MRLGLAATLMVYAVPGLLDGSRAWTAVDRDMRFLHADFSAQVVGLILLVVEVVAGLGMLTGYLPLCCPKRSTPMHLTNFEKNADKTRHKNTGHHHVNFDNILIS